jgi:outer membrane receptor protein involved in Fe transport
MSFNYRVLPQLTLGGSAAWTNARLSSQAKVLDINTVGARLPLSPRFNFALIGTYDFDIVSGYNGIFTVTDRWVGARNAGFGTVISPQYQLGAYNLTDLNLAVKAPHGLEYGLFLRNAFDRVAEVSASVLANEYNPDSVVPVVLAQPRTIGVSVNYKYR